MKEIITTLFNMGLFALYPLVSSLVLLLLSLLLIRRTIGKALLFCALTYLYISATGIIARPLINHLEKRETLISKKTIVMHKALILLGGGLSAYPHVVSPGIMSYSRILEADRIYQIANSHGIQYTLFISGGDKTHRGESEAEVYKHLLVELGVPAKHIITETHSKNTYQNAQYLKPILNSYPFKSYLLVSSAQHLPRAQLYFHHFNIHTIAAAADFPYPAVSALPRSYNLTIETMAIHEYGGILRLMLYNALGFN